MAGRIRSIKPEILDDEECSVMSDGAWRLWVSSWLLVDDAGNCRAGDKYLAALVWQDSTKASQIPGLLAELQVARRAHVYTNGAERFMALRNWSKHQRIDNAGKARVPGPEHEQSVAWVHFRGEVLGATDLPKSSPLDQRPRPTTNDPDQDHRPPDSRESAGGVVIPLALVPVDPPAPKFDFVAVYREHYPRKEGKKRGLEICEADVRTTSDFESWKRAVLNFASLMRAEGRAISRTKHFDSFMAVWRDYIDVAPGPSGVMDAASADKGRSLF